MINVTLGEVKPQVITEYPKIAILKDSGGVFLLLDEKYAVCLKQNTEKNWKSGEIYKGYVLDHFTDYNEPITIQNA